MSLLTGALNRHGSGGKAAVFLALFVVCLAGNGWGASTLASPNVVGENGNNETVAVFDPNKEADYLIGNGYDNPQFGQNSALEVLGLEIGIGGGKGGLGGAGGGGISLLDTLGLGAGANGEYRAGAGAGFYGGNGAALQLGSLLGSGLGITAGGGGGLTQGGGGFGLLPGLGNALLGIEGGGGGGLGITAADLRYSGQAGTMDKFYRVESGTLDAFGGSGAGGGLVGLPSDTFTLTAINALLSTLGINLLDLLIVEDGLGADITDIQQTGGTVNLLGGIGGGGGLLLDSNGGNGGGSVVRNANISGSTSVFNVYGGAGGGANAILSLATNGGDGEGGRLLGGSMESGTLNIFSGVDGGDIDSRLLAAILGLDILDLAVFDSAGLGGIGGGGYVENFTITGGAMYLRDGANLRDAAVADPNRKIAAAFGGGAAEAHNITNTGAGGAIYLDGGRLTGTYSQSGTASKLYLRGGLYDIRKAAGGNGLNGGGEFFGGGIYAVGGARELANADFGGTVFASGESSTNKLTLRNANITADGDLYLLQNATLMDGVNSLGGNVTLRGGGTLSNTYTQSGSGSQLLLENSTVSSSGLGGVPNTIARFLGGEILTVTGASRLDGATFAGTGIVTARSIGTAATLDVTNAIFDGDGVNLNIGVRTTLSSTVHTSGTVTLGSGGMLGGGYKLSGGDLVVGTAGSRPMLDDAVTFDSGGISSSVAGGVLMGGTYTGHVTASRGTAAASSLVISNAHINSTANLELQAGASLMNTTHGTGQVTLAGGTLGGLYTLTGTGILNLAAATADAGTGPGGAQFNGGAINAMGGILSTLTGGTFNGSVALTTEGAGSLLTISKSAIAGSANLNVGTGVTLDSVSLSAGRITMAGGGLSGSYAQSGTGELHLTRNTDMIETTNSISGGRIVLDSSGRFEFGGTANFTGSVQTDAALAASELHIIGSEVNIAAGGNLHLGLIDGSTEGEVILDGGRNTAGGTVTVNTNGSLGGTYTQSGGSTLVLNSSVAGGGAAGATLNLQGGTVRADRNVTLASTNNISGTVTADAAAGATLTINGGGGATTIAADGTLNLGKTGSPATAGRVVLAGMNNATGAVSVNTNGSLSGTYTQSGTGSLILNGTGSASNIVAAPGTALTAVNINGGTVQSNIAGATLVGANFGAGSTTLQTNGTGGTLTVSGSLNIEGNLTLKQNVTLVGGTSDQNMLENKGNLTLEQGSSLTGYYHQEEAHSSLTLAGTGVIDTDDLYVSGGNITSTVVGGSIGNLILNGEVGIAAEDGSSLVIDTAIVTKEFDPTGEIGETTDIDVTGNVTINNLIVEDAHLSIGNNTTSDPGDGEIDDEEDPSLTGNYTQFGRDAILVINEADGVKDLDNVRFGLSALDNDSSGSGGTLLVNTDGLTTIGHATIEGALDIVVNNDPGNPYQHQHHDPDGAGATYVADADAALLINKVDIIAGGDVALEEDVTFNNTTVSGGRLVIAGGTLTGKTILGGGTLALDDDEDYALDSSIDITGDSTFSTDLDGNGTADNTGELNVTDATIGEDGNAILSTGSYMDGKEHTQGTITLDTGGELRGTFEQEGEDTRLVIRDDDGNMVGPNDMIFRGGTVEAQGDDVTLTDTIVDGKLTTIATDGGSLTLTDTDIKAGSELEIGNEVTLAVSTDNAGAKITLTGTGEITGNYTQSGSSELVIAGDNTMTGGTYNGGKVTGGIADATLNGATFGAPGPVTAGVVDIEAGHTLEISNATINEKANLILTAGATLTTVTSNQGKITLQGGGLGDGYVQTAGTLELGEGGGTANGAIFKGGTIASIVEGSELVGALITGSVFPVPGEWEQPTTQPIASLPDSVTFDVSKAGSSLILTNATFGTKDASDTNRNGERAIVTVQEGVTINNSTFVNGMLTIGKGGILTGEYEQGWEGMGNGWDGGGKDALRDDLANLVIEDGAIVNIDGGTFHGGGIYMHSKDNATIKNMLFTGGELDVSAAGVDGGTPTGGFLHLVDAVIQSETGWLDLKENVIMESSTLADGTAGVTVLDKGNIMLRTGSQITGNFLQQDGGALYLRGGKVGDDDEETQTVFAGGEIHAALDYDKSKLETVTLADAYFTGEVDILTSGTDYEGEAFTSSMIIEKSYILDGGILDLKGDVELKDALLQDKNSAIILSDELATLTGEYKQAGGTLVLNGGDASDAAQKFTIGGGHIISTDAGSVLDGVDFVGEVRLNDAKGFTEAGLDVVPEGGTVAHFAAGDIDTMTVKNANILGGGHVIAGDKVTLDTVDLKSGQITMNAGSRFATSYTQSGGILNLNTGNITNNVTMNLFGGTINALTTAAIKEVKILERADGNVGGLFLTAADNAELRIETARIDQGYLSIGSGVVLGESGEGAAGLASGGTYLSDNGTLVLEKGGKISGEFHQSGGYFVLKTHLLESFEDISQAEGGISLTGGVMVVDVGEDNELVFGESGAPFPITFGGDDATSTSIEVVTGSIKFDNATIKGEMSVGGGVTMTATMEEGAALTNTGGGAEITLNPIADPAAEWSYTQTGEDAKVTLADGFTTEGMIEPRSNQERPIQLKEGEVVVADSGSATLGNTLVSGGKTVTAGATGGDLLVDGVTVAGKDSVFSVGEKVTEIANAGAINGGILELQINSSTNAAHGTYANTPNSVINLGGGGGLRMANDGGTALHTTATVGNVDANAGGVIHIDTDFANHKTDKFNILNSTGTIALNVDAIGLGEEILVLEDWTERDDASEGGSLTEGGARYSLASEYGDKGGASGGLTKLTLTARWANGGEEDGQSPTAGILRAGGDDNSHVIGYYLNAEASGLSTPGEGAASSPAAAMSQASIGMMEMGRHFSSLRALHRARSAAMFADDGSGDADGCGSCPPALTLGAEPAFDVWTAAYTHHMSVEEFGKTKFNLHGFDLGFDKRFDAGAGGSLYAGLVIGGQWLSNMRTETANGTGARNGEGSGKSYSVGAYGMWTNNSGWFADASFRHFWSDMDLTSYAVDGGAVSYSPRQSAFAVSANVGKRFTFGRIGEWYAEPSVGLTGILMKGKSFTTNTGMNVEYGTTKALDAMAAVAVGYTGSRIQPYAELALIQGLNGRTRVNMTGASVETDSSGTRFRGTLGASYSLNQNTSLFLNAAYERGSDFTDVNGSFGINFSW